ncbi:hypothetical protein FRX94_08780 [Corynebacterium canis]|uniref:Secreted protein n=1 Tax=Corynebacterium canis TaxID=679663 RepID=A0A5C5UDN5_9CORY|nr:hypothetical protein [Corynebacterium canis]TWT24146.1 hypothetical protein FRX94_08780 [Corynebacterium canis]WJY73956.1 hypothetical protein CCANI_00430 [Corynebacterium canis]
MIKKIFLPLALAATSVMAGCSNDDGANSQTPSTATTTTSATSSSSEPTTPRAEQQQPVTPPPAEPAATNEPYVVECLLDTPGQSLMSDGTVRNTEYCGSQSGAQPDPATIPFANGGTCPHYQCGYGVDANGNPNPSSGELQSLYACETGAITDQEFCTSLRERASLYGW